MTYDNDEFLESLREESDALRDTAFDDAELIFPNFIEVADRFVELYVSYRQRYVMMINGAIFIPKKKDSGPIKLSNSTICKHLHKKFAIGIFAGAYSSKFVCFDVDDGDQNTVRRIIALCEKFGIPREYIFVSSSGGKGYHVEVFFDTLVYTEKLRIFYDWVILKGGLNAQKVEFRPTASQAIKLPLSRHAKTGNICWYLDRETLAPIECNDYVLEIEQFSAETFNSLVDQCGLRKPVLSGNEDDVFAAMDPLRPKVRELTEEERAIFEGVSSHPDISQPGQRHALTRAIAIHNRRIGLTQEESEQDLISWWNTQDKTITTTTDKEAIADIRDLVRWTFSDGFIGPHRIKRMEITKDMLRATLSMKSKTEKKFMFLLCCYSSAYGRMNMGYERIAKYIGCSAITVRGIVSQLSGEGWIRVVPSRAAFSEGKYIRKPNTYYVSNEAFSATRDLDVSFCFEDPIVYEAKEISQDREDGRMRTVIVELEPDGFNDFYYQTMARSLTKKSLTDFLSRSEIKALRNRETA